MTPDPVTALRELVRLKDEHDAREQAALDGHEWASDGREHERKEAAWANARWTLAALSQQTGERVWTLLIGPGGVGVLPGEYPGYEGVERVVVVPKAGR